VRNWLFAVGILVVLAGFALVAYGSMSQGSVSTGGFILIGPFPIVFGSGGNGPQLAILSVLVGIVMLVLLTLWARRVYALSRSD
jgi:uncharacterized protein (TIGR00304 family)